MTHQNRKQTVPVRYSFPAVFLYLEMIPLCIFLYRGNEERSVSIMDFVRDDIRSIFRKYAFASIGSALAMSIYSMVDTIAVGHSTGAVGTAAMAVITPVYGTQAFLSSLCGVGGTVLMTKEKAMQNIKKGNSYFTVSLLMLSVLTAITWVLFGFFHNPLFRFFGATDEVLVYVNQYADLVIAFWPIFLFMIYLSLFLRSDGKPKLAFLSVLIGGGTNIFGDWFFCFPLKMGMRGAALATVIGSAIQVMIPILYLFSGKSSIRIEKPENLLQVVHDIAVIGFGSGIIELATVILAILLNNQITKYGGVAALSVYGIIATSNSLIQSMFSGLGQSVQPAVSANYSAKQYERIRELLKMAAITCVIMEILFVLLGELFPIPLVKLFTKPDNDVLALAPGMIRIYFLTYLFMGISILCIYILQATLKGVNATALSLMRGFIVSGVLIVLLPLILGLNGVTAAIVISECITSVTGVLMIQSGESPFGRSSRRRSKGHCADEV
jgi:Na+-driven multidrug efflux pump